MSDQKSTPETANEAAHSHLFDDFTWDESKKRSRKVANPGPATFEQVRIEEKCTGQFKDRAAATIQPPDGRQSRAVTDEDLLPLTALYVARNLLSIAITAPAAVYPANGQLNVTFTAAGETEPR